VRREDANAVILGLAKEEVTIKEIVRRTEHSRGLVRKVLRGQRGTDLPVIADADTGYGNALNLVRAVAEFEDAGAAAIHIEDQVTPKKCGHYSGKELISIGEMTKKLDAALAARRDPDMLIIARTEARAVEGMDGVCKRALAYAKIGVDAIFFGRRNRLLRSSCSGKIVSCRF
jgi:2-methylisocitrate lyase-like PEP mutase family enzyme